MTVGVHGLNMGIGKGMLIDGAWGIYPGFLYFYWASSFWGICIALLELPFSSKERLTPRFGLLA
jgi:hypothetical protein